jgi:hypothetical protein
LPQANKENGVSKADVPAVERIIADTINEAARGDPDALAARIVAALAKAGYRVVPTNGREDAALSPRRVEMRQLYRSPNGDGWFLARDPMTGSAFVRHQANAPSGGQVTDIEIGAFLSGPRNPEQDALLRRIGTLILDPKGANADAEPSGADIAKEWSDEEVFGQHARAWPTYIDEIARLLRRDHGDVREKVVEVGRACR